MSDVFSEVTATTTTTAAAPETAVTVGSAADLWDSMDAASPETEAPAPKKEAKSKPETETDDSDLKVTKKEESDDIEVTEPESIDEALAKEALKSEDQEEESEEVEAKETDEGENATESQAKLLKLKVGKDFVEIPENATIRKKIDGKWQVIPLNDIITNYSGKVGWEAKFNEVNQLRQAVAKKELEIGQDVQTLKMSGERVANAFKKSVFEGAYEMAKFSGVENVEQFANEIRNKAMQEAIEYLNMSEGERTLKDREDKINRLEQEQELKRNSELDSERHKAAQAEVIAEMESNKLSVDEFESGYQSLLTHNKNVDPRTVTPKMVSNWIKIERRGNYVMDTLAEIDEKLASDIDLVAEITRKSLSLNLSDAALSKVLKDKYRGVPKEVKAINEKLKEAGLPKETKKAESKKSEISEGSTVKNLWD